MRIAIRFVQIFVGILFVISGLVKANDPIGLAYKMEEFFELWSAGFTKASFILNALEALHKISLPLSISMITLEISTGVALLIGWKKKFIIWLLLVLIVFFTFLTGYAYLSGKFTNCGCFGDCLPITPLTSFAKDVVLTILILFLLISQKYIQPVLKKRPAIALLAVCTAASFGLQWYVLNYLPIADCLPFKKGNNIPQQMKPPAGSVPDSFAIRFVYEKGGRQFEFSPENLPADFSTYKYIDRKQSLVRKGNAEPAIKGFTLTGISGEDSTAIVLAEPSAILIFMLHFKSKNWMTDFQNLQQAAKQKGKKLYLASPSITEAQAFLKGIDSSNIQFFNTDFTVVRTVARTTPTVLLLKSGTVDGKWSKEELAKAADYLSAQPL